MMKDYKIIRNWHKLQITWQLDKMNNCDIRQYEQTGNCERYSFKTSTVKSLCIEVKKSMNSHLSLFVTKTSPESN